MSRHSDELKVCERHDVSTRLATAAAGLVTWFLLFDNAKQVNAALHSCLKCCLHLIHLLYNPVQVAPENTAHVF